MKFRICRECGCVVPEGQLTPVEYSPELQLILQSFTDGVVHIDNGSSKSSRTNYLHDVVNSYKLHCSCRSCTSCASRTDDSDLITMDSDKPISDCGTPFWCEDGIEVVSDSSSLDSKICLFLSVKSSGSSMIGPKLVLILGIVLFILGFFISLILLVFSLIFIAIGVLSFIYNKSLEKGCCLNIYRNDDVFEFGKTFPLNNYNKYDWKVAFLSEDLSSVGLVNIETKEKIRLTGYAPLPQLLRVYHVLCCFFDQDPGCIPVLMWKLGASENALNMQRNIYGDALTQSNVQAEMLKTMHDVLDQQYGSLMAYENKEENFI